MSDRPKTRGDCLAGGKNEHEKCFFVQCKYHLLTDVRVEDGRLRLNVLNPKGQKYPPLSPDATEAEAEEWMNEAVEALGRMRETCALDVVDKNQGGVSEREISEFLGTSRQAVGAELVGLQRKILDSGAVDALRSVISERV